MDIDQALNELRTNGNGTGAQSQAKGGAAKATSPTGIVASTGGAGRSIPGGLLGADDDDEDEEEEDDFREGEGALEDGSEDGYQAGTRSAARAALAANAQRNAQAASAREAEEQQRRRTSALAKFQEEERRERELLLAREQERNRALLAASAGGEAARRDVLQAEKQGVEQLKQRAAAPVIAGVEMEDESDSEDEEAIFQSDNRFSSSGASKAAAGGAALLATSEAASAAAAQGGGGRSLSPIPSATGHPSGTGGANVMSPQQMERDQQHQPAGTINSITRMSSDVGSPRLGSNNNASSFGGGVSSPTATATGTGTGFGGGSSTYGGDTATATNTAPSSVAGFGAGPGPGGDPSEWSIEQVCEWARARGWDEANVVSKFAEHEISGDVLLELDINMLKEIDITAFGTRHKVAVAIRDLKRAAAGGDPSAGGSGNVGSSLRSMSPALGGSANGAATRAESLQSFSHPQERISSFGAGAGAGAFGEPVVSPGTAVPGAAALGAGAGAGAGAAALGMGFPPSASDRQANNNLRDVSSATAPAAGAAGGFSPDMGYNGGRMADREVMSEVSVRAGLGSGVYIVPLSTLTPPAMLTGRRRAKLVNAQARFGQARRRQARRRRRAADRRWWFGRRDAQARVGRLAHRVRRRALLLLWRCGPAVLAVRA